ncbi:MAG: ABC transporter permease [Lachnospiraceae bacterium]|nr:ABC transporter permease [Lachnospiraceae bacterium]
MNKETSTLKRMVGHQLFMPIISLIIVMLITVVYKSLFGKDGVHLDLTFFQIQITNGHLYGYLIDILNHAGGLVILAIGMTLTVASSAGTDISVGAVSALCAAVCVRVLGRENVVADYSTGVYILAFIAAMLVGALCGVFNGYLVAYLDIQPMVATLILFTAGRGMAQLLVNGYIIYVRKESYKWLGSFFPHIPLPSALIVAMVVAVVMYLVLNKTALGLYIQAVGINKKASHVVGLNSKMIILLTYVFCGWCASINGLIKSSEIASVDANNIGLMMELDAILSVAIGGNSLGGGKFNLFGSIIGAVTIQALSTVLLSMSVESTQVPVFKALLVAAIVVFQSPEIQRWRRNRKARAAAAGKKVA